MRKVFLHWIKSALECAFRFILKPLRRDESYFKTELLLDTAPRLSSARKSAVSVCISVWCARSAYPASCGATKVECFAVLLNWTKLLVAFGAVCPALTVVKPSKVASGSVLNKLRAEINQRASRITHLVRYHAITIHFWEVKWCGQPTIIELCAHYRVRINGVE